MIAPASLLLLLPAACLAVPVVKIGSTSILGGEVADQEYFRGIPFAEPPVGNLRFQPPRLKTSLDDPTFDAINFGPGCLQAKSQYSPAELSEDCLTINIQRPAGVQRISGLPVLVWVYGGGFMVGGSSTYDATSLVARSIARGTPAIYVSFNYRLSALGFPSGPDSASLGILNLGLRDQLTAFEWVNKNIAAFGGDPKKVTLFGESAGAWSISLHQFNPRLPEVVRAVILESGSALVSSYHPSLRADSFAQFVQDLGCADNPSEMDLLSCLQNVDSERLRKAVSARAPDTFSFAPELDGPSGLIPDYPSRLLAAGKYIRIPTLLGRNLDEGTSFIPTSVNSTQEIKDLMLSTYRGPTPDSVTKQVVNRLLELYPDIPALGSPYGTGNETFGFSSQFKRLASLLGDLSIVAPARTIAQYLSQRGVKTYSYIFTENYSAYPPYLGVPHVAEVSFVYGNPSPEPVPDTAKYLSVVMMDYWLSFASVLQPNDGRGVRRLNWVPYIPSTQLIMNLDGRGLKLVKDDIRSQGTEYIAANSIALGV